MKVARVRKARAKAKARTSPKVTEANKTPKVKASSQSSSDTLTGIGTSVVNTDTRNQNAAARAISSVARITNVEHMGTRELIVLQKTMAHLESRSVNEPSEEPLGMESLEWLFALETHDG